MYELWFARASGGLSPWTCVQAGKRITPPDTSKHVLRIAQDNTSAPIGFYDMKAILLRTSPDKDEPGTNEARSSLLVQLRRQATGSESPRRRGSSLPLRLGVWQALAIASSDRCLVLAAWLHRSVA